MRWLDYYLDEFARLVFVYKTTFTIYKYVLNMSKAEALARFEEARKWKKQNLEDEYNAYIAAHRPGINSYLTRKNGYYIFSLKGKTISEKMELEHCIRILKKHAKNLTHINLQNVKIHPNKRATLYTTIEGVYKKIIKGEETTRDATVLNLMKTEKMTKEEAEKAVPKPRKRVIMLDDLNLIKGDLYEELLYNKGDIRLEFSTSYTQFVRAGLIITYKRWLDTDRMLSSDNETLTINEKTFAPINVSRSIEMFDNLTELIDDVGSKIKRIDLAHIQHLNDRDKEDVFRTITARSLQPGTIIMIDENESFKRWIIWRRAFLMKYDYIIESGTYLVNPMRQLNGGDAIFTNSIGAIFRISKTETKENNDLAKLTATADTWEKYFRTGRPPSYIAKPKSAASREMDRAYNTFYESDDSSEFEYYSDATTQDDKTTHASPPGGVDARTPMPDYSYYDDLEKMTTQLFYL